MDLIKDNYKVLGVMSGTSLDGVDIAEIEFSISKNKQWTFSLITCETISYSNHWKNTLQRAIKESETNLIKINQDYTGYLGKLIADFIKKNNIQNLDAVCSHGHTILHQPAKGITLQIGNLPELATYCKQFVVCDFRVQDVQLGGQGAPLVPIGDALLFAEYDYCLNLGGFANISYSENGKRVAYDICPVNIVLNKYAEKLGKAYDENGKIAASGELNETLYKQLNELSYYQKSAPKSLGLEWVQEQVFPILDTSIESSRNILHTFVKHIAFQLSLHFSKNSKVLITGGGTFNSYLLTELKYHTDIIIDTPSKKIIEFKEALIFGLLGVLKLREENNCLASVTGAIKDHSSGKIYMQ